MQTYTAAFESFIKTINDHVENDDAGLTEKDMITMGSIWEHTNNFLTNNNLVTGDLNKEDVGYVGKGAGLENMSAIVFDRIQSSGIAQLVKDCKVPQEFQAKAVEGIARVLTDDNITGASPMTFLAEQPISTESSDVSIVRRAAEYVPAVEMYQQSLSSALEEFGKDSDNVVSDLRLSIAVTILKYHKGILDRLIHRRTATENVVRFKVVGAEVLDLTDTTQTVDGNNKAYNVGKPFIDHYHDPSNLDSTQKPVVPLKDNDTGATAFLLEDGVLKFGTEVPTLNLSLKKEVGYDRMDHSDMVAEGVTLTKLRLKFIRKNGADPDTEEVIEFDVTGRPRARFLMQMNTAHSSDRLVNLDEVLFIDANTLTKAGANTTIFQDFTGDAKLALHVRASGKINLNNGLSLVDISATPAAKMLDGSTPASPLTSIASNVSIDVENSGYELEEYFSEENIRKSSTLIRTTTRTIAYEIPGTKNILVDFSLRDIRPDDVLGVVIEAQNLGLDFRGINLILKQMQSVYNQLQQEKNTAYDNSRRDGVCYNYPAGLKVKPHIFQSTFDVLSHVKNDWTGQKNGDVRSALENYLMEMFAMIHSKTLYVQALNPGEKIVWRCLTSGPIKELLFNIPHYHNHLNTGTDNGNNSDIEYTRVLPNGVVLEMFTTSWDIMSDTILFIPYRKSMPKDVTNFAFNADMGSYVANIQVQSGGAAYKRVITNAKEIPVVTNPVAAKVNLINVAEIFEDGPMGITPSTP